MAPQQLSCWSWRRSKWPRKKARSESALTAQTKAQHRCDCPPERSPASPPGLAPCHALCWHSLSTGQSSGSGTGSECSKRHLRASQHPPILSQQKLSTTTPLGVFQILPNFNPILDSFVKLKTLTQTSCRPIPLPLLFSFTLHSVPQMVSSSFDPFQPTAAELAGDDPADGANADQSTES
eukprot:scaffold2380_cov102-Isochrysis_galbana.AAC.1